MKFPLILMSKVLCCQPRISPRRNSQKLSLTTYAEHPPPPTSSRALRTDRGTHPDSRARATLRPASSRRSFDPLVTGLRRGSHGEPGTVHPVYGFTEVLVRLRSIANFTRPTRSRT